MKESQILKQILMMGHSVPLSIFFNEKLVEKVHDEHKENKATNAKESEDTKHKKKQGVNVPIKGVQTRGSFAKG
jgi:hypothetical protein